jgi:beta-lactamase regulating signal transducer with metallopeptidase domain
MRSAFDAMAYWLIDYYVAAMVVLTVVGVIQRAIRQPARRMAVHWGTLVGLALLVFLCVLPGWPRVRVMGIVRATPDAVAEPAPKRSGTDSNNRLTTPTTADSSIDGSSRQRSIDSKAPRPLLPQNGGWVVLPNDAVPAAKVPRAAPAPSEPAGLWGWVANRDWGLVRLTALAIFVLGWVLTTFRVVHGLIAARRVRLDAFEAPQSVVAELKKLVGNGRCPELLVSCSHPIPIVIGTLRPKILLPPQFAEKERPDDCRSVLAHELAHVHNGDLWLLALDRWLLPLLWMHPLYLRLRRSLRDDQELLADSVAASHSSRADYADMLVRWARRLAAEKQALQLSAAVGVWDRPTRLHDRIARLLHPSQRLELYCPRFWRMGSLLSLIALPTLLSTATVCPESPRWSDIFASLTSQPESNRNATCCHHRCSAAPATPPTPYFREQPAMAQILRLGGSIKSGRIGNLSFVTEVNMLFHETKDGQRVANKTIAEAPLPDLATFSHLRVLSLAGSQVTDSGLRKLSTLTELESLTLRDAHHLTEAGIAELARLPQLRRLELTNAHFEDVALDRLAGMRTLEELSVEGRNLSDETIEIAARMPNLRSLSLDLPNSQVDREAVISLHALPKLACLNLRCLEIPDDALFAVKSLASLRSLSLGDSRVSRRALARLRRSLPDLAVQTSRQTVRTRSRVSSEQTKNEAPRPNQALAQAGSSIPAMAAHPDDSQTRIFTLRFYPPFTKVEWKLTFVDSNVASSMSREFVIRIDATLVFRCRLRRVGSDWKAEQFELTSIRDGVEEPIDGSDATLRWGRASKEWTETSGQRTID